MAKDNMKVLVIGDKRVLLETDELIFNHWMNEGIIMGRTMGLDITELKDVVRFEARASQNIFDPNEVEFSLELNPDEFKHGDPLIVLVAKKET